MAYISHQIRNIAIFVLVDKSPRLMTSKKTCQNANAPILIANINQKQVYRPQHQKSNMLLCDADEERQLNVPLHGTL